MIIVTMFYSEIPTAVGNVRDFFYKFASLVWLMPWFYGFSSLFHTITYHSFFLSRPISLQFPFFQLPFPGHGSMDPFTHLSQEAGRTWQLETALFCCSELPSIQVSILTGIEIIEAGLSLCFISSFLIHIHSMIFWKNVKVEDWYKFLWHVEVIWGNSES